MSASAVATAPPERAPGAAKLQRAVDRSSRPLAGLALAVFAFVALLCTPAGGVPIDGISDQNLAYWERGGQAGPFDAFFRETWVGDPPSHIRYARFVVQWNAMALRAKEPYGHYFEQFVSWYSDVRELGLMPDIAFGSYVGAPPGSAQEYERVAGELLAAYPAPYVEAWNEPNHTLGLPVARAAEFMDAAYLRCRAEGCTAIAGDFLDTAGAAAYAREYKADLSAVDYPQLRNPPDWGLHPYEAANRVGSEAQAIRQLLPTGDRLWITEVGVYYCEKQRPLLEFGEARQARLAERLVRKIIPALDPVHVFYDYFMYQDELEAPCARYSDSALYGVAGEPRAAASVIFGSPPGQPFAFPGSAADPFTLPALR